MLTRRSALVAGALAMALLGNAAQAQSYPDHPVKIVVPSPPAGSYDILGRVVADQLTKRMGQSFVVENRTGAGTVVGTKSVATAAPDGYTLLVGGLSNIIFNAGLYKTRPYDPINDFVPVALSPEHLLFAGRLQQLAAKVGGRDRRRRKAKSGRAQAGERRSRHRAARRGRGVSDCHRRQVSGGAVSWLVGGVPRSYSRPR